MKLGVYLDYYKNSLLRQIELAGELSVSDKLILRNVNGIHFLDTNIQTDILPYLNIKNIYLIDLGKKILAEDKTSLETQGLKSILSLVKVSTIIFTLDFSKSIEANVTYINFLLDTFTGYTFLLRIYDGVRGVIIESILSKVSNKKRIAVLFDPANLYVNNLSFLTEYRILKNEISSVVLNDINEKEHYTLIGYGDLKIIDFYKRLYSDHFQGLLIYDSKLEKALACFEEKVKVKNKLLKSLAYRKDYLFFKSKLNLEKKDKLEIIEVIRNQLTVIGKIFNLD